MLSPGRLLAVSPGYETPAAPLYKCLQQPWLRTSMASGARHAGMRIEPVAIGGARIGHLLEAAIPGSILRGNRSGRIFDSRFFEMPQIRFAFAA